MHSYALALASLLRVVFGGHARHALLFLGPEETAVHPLVVHADMNSDAEHAGECCGHLDEPACTKYDVTTGWTTHSCFSNGLPTVGAVKLVTSDNYTCQICGRPQDPACECTQDNAANEHDHAAAGHYSLPCGQGLSYWCLNGPQYSPVPDADGRWICKHNDSTAELLNEIGCGVLDRLACLDSATSVHSCASPATDGSMVRAMQRTDDANAPFECLRCNNTGGPACPQQHPEDVLADEPPRTCDDKMRRSRSLYRRSLLMRRGR